MSSHGPEGPQSPGQDASPDESVARAWQQASDERPPPELDAAIIAAARKAVVNHGAGIEATRTRSRLRNRWTQWQPLAAAATVAGLAFILVQLLPRDREVAPPVRMEEPAPGPAAAEQGPDSDRADNAVPTQVAPAPAASVPPATAEAAGSGVATGSVASKQAGEADQRTSVSAEMASPAAPAAAAAPTTDRSLGNVAPPSAADWAARIATLYASGDTSGAAEALRAFRAADPDADTYLPDSLRDWARTVK